MREFQRRKSRDTDGRSASEVQDAEREYEVARERHRILASSLEKEDSVIIRHKPTKAAPIVIPATRALPPALKLDMSEVPAEALREQVNETAVATAAKPQVDRIPEGDPAKQTSTGKTINGYTPPLLSEKPCTFSFSHSTGWSIDHVP